MTGTNEESREWGRGRRAPHERGVMWKTLQVPVRVCSTVFFDLKAYHTERVPKSGGVLLLSNHQSYLDPPLLGAQLDRSMAYLAKSELFKFGPFAWLIRSLNAFPVRQGAGDLGAMREAIRLLEAGWMLNVFPEGTRTPDGSVQPSEKGASLLVKRVKVPVVPAVIDGAFKAAPRGVLIPRPHPIRILYGHPVDLSHLKGEEIRKWIDETLTRMLADLRAGRV